MKVRNLLLLASLLLFICNPSNGDMTKLEDQSVKWIKVECQGIKLVLALNTARDTPPLRRKIFLLVNGRDFTEEKLRKIFDCFATQNPTPMTLTISASSSKKMLKKAIHVSQLGHSIDFVDTPEGRKARDEYYKKHYPAKTGHWSAFYYRDLDREWFHYSPDPNKEERIKIVIRDKSAPPR